MEGEKCLWILARPRIITTKKEDPSVSTVIGMDI